MSKVSSFKKNQINFGDEKKFDFGLPKCQIYLVVMGVMRIHSLDEVNTNDEVIPSDEKISHH